MKLEEAKKEVSEILRKVIHAEEVYYLDGKYVRWGRVEKDLHAVIERLLTQRAGDVCPVCNGLKIVRNDDGLGSQTCPACDGTGKRT